MPDYRDIVRARIAPTPSGYLHEGNAANALLTSWWARALGGTVVLRIDDADPDRSKDAFVADILDVLAWVDVHVDEGPGTVADLHDTWSQRLRTHRYREAALALAADGRAFACTCPRGTRDCTCRQRTGEWQPGVNALRWNRRDIVDPVLWRRDDVPAYHLTSVVDDDLWAIDHVVRGKDLEASTTLQRDLATELGLAFPGSIVHHPLAMTPDGDKLSKSTLARGPMPRTDEVRAHIIALAHEWAEAVGIPAPKT